VGRDGIEPPTQGFSDIFIFLSYLCDYFGIDLLEATEEKIKLNEKKYPISKSYNSNKKYNQL